jgi:hypothetical protein
MAKYRYTDKQETNEHGQTLGFAHWIGGPSLTYVSGIVCSDGKRRNWFKTNESDTYFSVPGYVHCKGNKVKGCLTSGEINGACLYTFRECAADNFSRHIPLLHAGDESSHASLLDCDIVSGILNLCQSRSIYLSMSAELKLILSFHNVLEVRPDATWEDLSKHWRGQAIGSPTEIIEDAFNELNALCPEGYYFGSHPGDGSLFGVWEAEE